MILRLLHIKLTGYEIELLPENINEEEMLKTLSEKPHTISIKKVLPNSLVLEFDNHRYI